MQVKVEYMGEGSTHSLPELYSAAWDECAEAHIMDKFAWMERAMNSVQMVARYEFHAILDGRVVGAMVVAEEADDPHVGCCLSVLYNYILPEYRDIGIAGHFLRGAMRLAKSLGYPVLAYTHRVGAGRYLTTYRRTH